VPPDPTRSLVHAICGADSIANLFGATFRFAVHELPGDDVATLLHAPSGDIARLGWASEPMWSALRSLVDALALRDAPARLRVRKPEHGRLIDLLGGARGLGNARLAFLVAYALDERYCSVSPRVEATAGMAVVELPSAFLGESSNGPPSLGQMTPLAACRRWMRAFWYVGGLRNVGVFGPLPRPRSRTLPPRTRETLTGALTDGELRLAIVSWKRHAPADLASLPARPGCFAIGGLMPEPSASELRALLEAARATRPHLVVFPELAFSKHAFDGLVSALASAGGRFPALTVVGRAHRARPTGGYDNVAAVVDARGRILLEHEKIEPYSTGSLLEDILPRASGEYEYLDTPLGRLVVNVCRDVRSDIPMLMNRALGVTLLMVPAYSRKLDFALEEARVLGARQRAIVVSANAASSAVGHEAALYAPIKGTGESSVLREIGADGAGTVHAFSITIGDRGRAKIDGHPRVAV
jgi:predicted amidohydrolase